MNGRNTCRFCMWEMHGLCRKLGHRTEPDDHMCPEYFTRDQGVSIDVMELSYRTYNGLISAGITTIEQVELMSDNALLKIHGFGKKCVDEIHAHVRRYRETEPKGLA